MSAASSPPFGGSGGHNRIATFARLRFAVLASNFVPSGRGTSLSVSLPAILQRRSTFSLRSFLGLALVGFGMAAFFFCCFCGVYSTVSVTVFDSQLLQGVGLLLRWRERAGGVVRRSNRAVKHSLGALLVSYWTLALQSTLGVQLDTRGPGP